MRDVLCLVSREFIVAFLTGGKKIEALIFPKYLKTMVIFYKRTTYLVKKENILRNTI